MVAKMLGILPNCFVSPSKVSRTSGAAFSFTGGLTMAMRQLLICEGITWSQESIPNAAQLGTDTGIPTSLTNSPRQRTRMVGKPETEIRMPANFRVARHPSQIDRELWLLLFEWVQRSLPRIPALKSSYRLNDRIRIRSSLSRPSLARTKVRREVWERTILMRLFNSLRYGSASWLLAGVVALNSMAQDMGETPRVALQPLAQHVRQVQEALSFLGQPLLAADTQRINAAIGLSDE